MKKIGIIIGIIVAAIVVFMGGGFVIPRLHGGADPGTRRWATLNPSEPSTNFNVLVHPPPANALLPHSAIGSEPANWNLPHVAVYSIANSLPVPAPVSAPATKAAAGGGQSSLGTPADPAVPLPQQNEPFELQRILVATVTKGADWGPGDRMLWTRLFVQPINFEFAGYTVAATEREALKIASVETTASCKTSADLGLAVPGIEGAKPDVSRSSENSLKTTSDISAQYEKLGVDIMPRFLRIIRESERGGDVAGNTTVTLSVRTDPTMIQKAFPDDNERKRQIGDDVVLLVTATHLQKGPPICAATTHRLPFFRKGRCRTAR